MWSWARLQCGERWACREQLADVLVLDALFGEVLGVVRALLAAGAVRVAVRVLGVTQIAPACSACEAAKFAQLESAIGSDGLVEVISRHGEASRAELRT